MVRGSVSRVEVFCLKCELDRRDTEIAETDAEKMMHVRLWHRAYKVGWSWLMYAGERKEMCPGHFGDFNLGVIADW
jgi:hypothetical protein